MYPIDFPDKTLDLQKPRDMTDEECSPLPIFRDEASRSTVSCWRPTWRERLSILFFGKVWLGVHAGGMTQPPVWLSARRDIFIRESRYAWWRKGRTA